MVTQTSTLTIRGWLRHAGVHDEPAVRMARIAGLIVGAFALDWWVHHAGHLSEAAYAQPSVAAQLIVARPDAPLVLVLGAAMALSRVGRRGWAAFEQHRRTRAFAGILAALVAWTCALYDINAYAGQAHLVDRGLVIALALAVWAHPAFLLPLLALAHGMLWQFDYPLTWQFNWEEINMPLRVLAVLCVAAFVPRGAGLRTRHILGAILCVVAASYLCSAIGKLQIDWLSMPTLQYLPLGGFTHGWLSQVGTGALQHVIAALAVAAVPLMAATVLLELGSAFVLCCRRGALMFLAAVSAFHGVVLLLTGIAFWHWMIVYGLLIAFLLTPAPVRAIALFPQRAAPLYSVLVFGAVLLFRPAPLAWHDTRVVYVYEVEGVDRAGARTTLPPDSFTPFEDIFTFGNFGYLNAASRLTGQVMGAVEDSAQARAVNSARTPDAVFAVERQFGHAHFDAGLSAAYDSLVQHIVMRLNASGGESAPWAVAHAPRHLWNTLGRPALHAPIVRVRVHMLTWLYDDEQLRMIRDEVVREVAIPQ